MNRFIAIIGLGLLGSNLSLAGDVVYTMWEDDDSQIWIRIQNDMDRKIVIESISLVFYDRRGKPIAEKQQKCKENCSLGSHDATELGPYSYPEGSHSSRVRYLKYSVQ